MAVRRGSLAQVETEWMPVEKAEGDRLRREWVIPAAWVAFDVRSKDNRATWAATIHGAREGLGHQRANSRQEETGSAQERVPPTLLAAVPRRGCSMHFH